MFIAIDANIGSGKTALCHSLYSVLRTRKIKARVFEEPTNTKQFRYFLSRHVEALKKGINAGEAFEMQCWMLVERYAQHKLAVEYSWNNNIWALQDRPIYGDSVFAVVANKRGFMSNEQLVLYSRIFSEMSRDLMPPDIFVYLNVSPEIAYERMNERGRKAEDGVPLDYLQDLDSQYQVLLNKLRLRGIPVLEVPWEKYGAPLKLYEQIVEITRNPYEYLSKQKIVPSIQ